MKIFAGITWQTIVIIVSVLAGIIVMYAIIGTIMYFISKRKAPKLEAELYALCEFEVERGKKVLAAIDELDRHGYNFDSEARDTIAKGVEDIKSLDMDQRAHYKNMVDYSSFFIAKIHREDRKYGKYISKEVAEEFHHFHEVSAEKYAKYNKLAAQYNAFRHSLFAKLIAKIAKDKNSDAILF